MAVESLGWVQCHPSSYCCLVLKPISVVVLILMLLLIGAILGTYVVLVLPRIEVLLWQCMRCI